MFAKATISNALRHVRKVCCRTNTLSDDQSESGAALVEFTVLMPVLFLLLFGIIEFGMIIFSENNMTNAARQGARAAAVKGGTLAQANTAACTFLMGTGQTFTITTTIHQNCPGPSTTVQGDATTAISVPAASASLMNTFFTVTNGILGATTWAGTFSSKATMREEFVCTAAVATATCSCNTAASPPTGC